MARHRKRNIWADPQIPNSLSLLSHLISSLGSLTLKSRITCPLFSSHTHPIRLPRSQFISSSPKHINSAQHGTTTRCALEAAATSALTRGPTRSEIRQQLARHRFCSSHSFLHSISIFGRFLYSLLIPLRPNWHYGRYETSGMRIRNCDFDISFQGARVVCLCMRAVQCVRDKTKKIIRNERIETANGQEAET